VNRSLLARTRPEFYAEYRHAARRAGQEDAAIDAAIATSIREAKSLLEGKCPKCGAPSARYVDRRHQQGPSQVPGEWVMYRCSTVPPPGEIRPEGACDFMTDLKEGQEAN
jgi:hypothetical protein